MGSTGSTRWSINPYPVYYGYFRILANLCIQGTGYFGTLSILYPKDPVYTQFLVYKPYPYTGEVPCATRSPAPFPRGTWCQNITLGPLTALYTRHISPTPGNGLARPGGRGQTGQVRGPGRIPTPSNRLPRANQKLSDQTEHGFGMLASSSTRIRPNMVTQISHSARNDTY